MGVQVFDIGLCQISSFFFVHPVVHFGSLFLRDMLIQTGVVA